MRQTKEIYNPQRKKIEGRKKKKKKREEGCLGK
jgi:peptide deformylase